MVQMPSSSSTGRSSVGEKNDGISAFRLLYGCDRILRIEFSTRSWSTIDWEAVKPRKDLTAARMKQLVERELEEAIAAERLERARLGDKRLFDEKRRLRSGRQELKVGDLVLLHNSAIDTSHNVKLEGRWLGPYRVREVSDAGLPFE